MMHPTTIRIMIVDDHDILREGIAALLRLFADLELVSEVGSGMEAIEACQRLQPDVILMDLKMPGMDGTEAIRRIHTEYPAIHIIALTSFSDRKLINAALAAGARSYLMKNISAEQLTEAIRSAHSGLPTLAPEAMQALMERGETSPEKLKSALTPREFSVLELLVEGRTNAEIGRDLNISQFTVKNHVSKILSKLGVAGRTEAVSFALRNQLIQTN